MKWVLILLLLRSDSVPIEDRKTFKTEADCWAEARAVQAQINHAEYAVAHVRCERKG